MQEIFIRMKNWKKKNLARKFTKLREKKQLRNDDIEIEMFWHDAAA